MAKRFENSDPETTYFRYVRDQNGKLVPVNFARRNRRLVPYFPPSMTEPAPTTDPEELPNYRELIEELTQKLNPVERRTWFLIIRDGKSIKEAAAEEGVSRQAIYDRLRRMIRKNEYCAICAVHGVLKHKINQHL